MEYYVCYFSIIYKKNTFFGIAENLVPSFFNVLETLFFQIDFHIVHSESDLEPSVGRLYCKIKQYFFIFRC